jgi:hypothetical protein
MDAMLGSVELTHEQKAAARELLFRLVRTSAKFNADHDPLFRLVHVGDDGMFPPWESLDRLMARLRTMPPDDYEIGSLQYDGGAGFESTGCEAVVGEGGSVQLDIELEAMPPEDENDDDGEAGYN